MPKLRSIFNLFVLICALFASFGAQAREEIPQGPICSVITVAPGDSLDSLFGHTALRIQDPFLGEGDVWFDYGVFDPSDWTFWIHYAKGDAHYLLVAADPQERLAEYKKLGRQVTQQKLNLTAEEVQKLEDYLIEDLRHGCGKNGYEYRFLDDNCTTRVMRMIEGVTGEKFKAVDKATYRRHTDMLLSAQPWAQLGANLLMGSHAERENNTFLPYQLSWSLKLEEVKKERANTPQTQPDVVLVGATIPDWIGTLVLHLKMWVHIHLSSPAIILFSLFFLLTIPTLLRPKKRIPLPSRPYLDSILFSLIGLIGCLMTFLGFWSLHPELGAFNWNLIWCWPTHLIFAFLLLFPSKRNLCRAYARVATLGVTCAILAYFFVPQALPVPLFPVALLLGLRAWRLGWGEISQPIITDASNTQVCVANP